jgi:hypothetical protein
MIDWREPRVPALNLGASGGVANLEQGPRDGVWPAVRDHAQGVLKGK